MKIWTIETGVIDVPEVHVVSDMKSVSIRENEPHNGFHIQGLSGSLAVRPIMSNRIEITVEEGL